MLIYPYLLKGVAALRAMFILAAGTSASRYSHYIDTPTIGAAFAFTVCMALTRSVLPPPVPHDEPPLSELIAYSMMANPTSLLDSDTSSSMTTDLDGSVADVDIALFAAEPESTPLAEPATGFGTLQFDTSAPTFVIVDVPELDWTNPGAPTIKAPKVKEKKSDVIHYDFFFFGFISAPENSTFWDESKQSPPPAAPDDNIPPMRRYEAPELTFDVYCRKKGKVPDMDLFTLCRIMAIRFLVLAYTLQDMVHWLAPIPRLVRRAWRARRRARRPLSERRLMRYRRR